MLDVVDSKEVKIMGVIEVNNGVSSDAAVRHSTRRDRVRRKVLSPTIASIAATLSILGGISSLVAGLICVGIHAILSGDTGFDRVGTVLLIIAIPLILLGSVFLDEIERNK